MQDPSGLVLSSLKEEVNQDSGTGALTGPRMFTGYAAKYIRT